MTEAETKQLAERTLLTAHALVQCNVEKTPTAALTRVTNWIASGDNELTGSAPKNALKIAMSPQQAKLAK